MPEPRPPAVPPPPGPESARRRRKGGRGRRRRLLLAGGGLLGLLVVGGLASALLLRASPAERAAHFLELGRMRLAQGRPDEALPLLEQSLAVAPEGIEARRAVLHALSRLERDDEAAEAARALLALAPDDGLGHRFLARSLWSAGERETALEHAEAALRDPGERSAALRLRAGFHLARGALAAALADLDAAVLADPDDARSAFLGARIARVLGRLAGDVELLDRARRGFEAAALVSGPDDDVALLRIAALLESGAPASARAALLELPEARRPPDLAARIETALGGHAPAERLARESLAGAASPDAVHRARAQLVQALLAAGRLPEAGVEFEPLAKELPDDVRISLLRRALALAEHLRTAPEDRLFRVLVDSPLAVGIEDAGLVASLVAPPAGEVPPSLLERRARLGWWGPLALRTGESSAAAVARDRLRDELAALRAESRADPVGALWRAATALRAGDGPTAREAAALAVAAAPRALEPALVQALAFSATGRGREALDAARRATRTHPGDVRAALVHVQALTEAGETLAAVEAIRAARAAWPRDPSVAILLGTLPSGAEGASADAGRALAAAHAALAEGDLRRVAEIAAPLLGEPETEEAARALVADAFATSSAVHAEAEAAAPDDPVPSIRRAQSLLVAGRVERAEQVLREAAERQAGPTARFALARLLVSRGRTDEALAALDAARDGARSAADRVERGRVLLAGGRTAEACAAWRSALAVADDGSLTFRARRRAALTLLLHDDDPAADVAAAIRSWVAREEAAATDDSAQRQAELDVVRGHLLLHAGETEAALATAERLLAVATGDEPEPDATLLAAVSETRLGRLAAAESRLVGLLVRRPFQRAARRLLARVRIARAAELRSAGDAVGAAQTYVHAIGLADVDASAVLALARLAAESDAASGEGPDLERLATSLDRDHPLRAAGPLLRAFHRRTAGAPRDWLPALREAYRREPGAPVVQGLVVEALLQAGEAAEARRICDALCALPDRTGVAHALLGRVLASLGDRPGARAALSTALERDPRNDAARRRLAEVLLDEGLADAAQEVLEPCQTVERPARPLELAALLVRAGDPGAAIAVLRRVLDHAPSVALHVALARTLRAGNDLPGAARELDAALRLDPTAPEPALARLGVARAAGELDALRTRFAAAGRDETHPPAARAVAHLVLGVLAQSQDDLDGAEAAYRAALAVAPDGAPAVPLVANNLAWLLGELRGRPADGLPFARRALAAAPDDPEILDTLGRLLDRAGEPAVALPLLTRAVEAAPGRAGPRLHRADVLLSLARFDEARAEYERALTEHPDAARAHGAEDRLAELAGRTSGEAPR